MPPPTHFLCIPLVTSTSLPQLTSSLARFAQDKAVVKTPLPDSRNAGRRTHSTQTADSDTDTESEDGQNSKQSINMTAHQGIIPLKAVRPVGALHLTLGVMVLKDSERIKAACEFLETLDARGLLQNVPTQSKDSTSSSDQDVTQGQLGSTKSDRISLLTLELKGLHPMQKPHQTRVLYAAPHDPSNRLLPFCQALRDKFVEVGFVVDEDRELKLHATIVNTIYASRGARRGARRGSKLEFDATDVIERWKDEVWAEIVPEKIAICEMGAKEDEKGMVRYREIAEVGLTS